MRYELGKPFVSDPIEPSQPMRPLDYYVPTYDDNLKYLKLLNTEVLPLFEKEFISRRQERLQYEQQKNDPKFYNIW